MKDTVPGAMPEDNPRDSGVAILGRLAWGSHLCNFYDSKQDLLDILIPYFKTGLESNEFCFWVTSDPITVEDALHALRQAVPGLDGYVKRRSIEILPYAEWYLKGDQFDPEYVINRWSDKLNMALASGFDGMRVHSNESWLGSAAWKDFIGYEKQLNAIVANRQMIMLCAYPLSMCDAARILDVAQAHACMVIKRSGRWNLIEAPALKQSRAQIKARNAYLEQLVAERTSELAIANEKLKKEFALHKQTVEVLRKSEAHLRTIFDHTDTGYILLDTHQQILSFNHLASGFMTREFQSEMKTGEQILNCFSGTEKPIQEQRIRKVLEGHQVNVEVNYPQPAEATNWYNLRMFPIRNNENKIFGLMMAISYINDRKKAEEEIRLSEERYRYLFNHNPATIFIWDPDTLKIIEVNDTAVKAYGYSREEFLQKTPFDLRPEEEFPRYNDLVNMVRSEDTGLKITGNWKHRTRSGEIMVMNIVTHKIRYWGKPVILSLVTNVTDKVVLEQKLEEERISKQQEITDAVITAQENERHEISRELHDNVNQILAVSRLYLGMAKKAELAESRPNIEEADNLIDHAINEIRKLSHSLTSSFLEEYGLFKALNHLMETISGKSKLIVEKELQHIDGAALPDKLRLAIYRIVQEQLSNILKYANAKTIHVRLARDNEKIILTIKDDGVGFDTTKKVNGIGLMNIKARALLFNGNMRILSSPGNGCALTVYFNGM